VTTPVAPPAGATIPRGPWPTLAYLFRLESHVYAFAISACLLLSYFPFLVLLLTFVEHILRWPGASATVYAGVRAALPDDPGLESFVVTNLRVAVAARGGPLALSALMLIFSSNGVFGPLEVALNRLWGFPRDRPYWRNVLLGLLLASALGLLFVGGTLLGTKGAQLLSGLPGLAGLPAASRQLIALLLVAVPLSILGFLLVYWRLPHGRVPLIRAARAALVAGLSIHAVRLGFLNVWPYLGFRRIYGPFFISVTLLVWGYVAALTTLAVAEIETRAHRAPR
jgi:uncharacterized BrkB/YihY/UPF0761 family membrane protein